MNAEKAAELADIRRDLENHLDGLIVTSCSELARHEDEYRADLGEFVTDTTETEAGE